MIAIKDMEIPKSCIECEKEGIRFVNHCQLIFDGRADIERHPNCPLVKIVTCKDCNHCKDIVAALHKDGTKKMLHVCKKHEMGVSEDFFCGDREFKVSGSPNIKLEEDVPYNERRE